MNDTPLGLHFCDDLIFTSRVSGVAKSQGLTIRATKNVADLLLFARQALPRCVIIDINMPGLAIDEMVRELAALTPKPFVVGYGSHVDTATLKKARDAGCDIVWPRSKFVEELGDGPPLVVQVRGVVHVKRISAIGFAWLTLAIGIAHAVPARPLYEPPEPPKVAVPDLRDTVWQGIEAPDRNIYFHSDGQLSYTRGQAGFGTWRLEGSVVYFEFNNRYREFRGSFQGNIIQGDSWNIAGKRWVTTLQRVPAP